MLHNVELKKGAGGQLARSAGASVQLLAREGEYATLRLNSGEVRMVRSECMATIGQVGNLDHENISIGKAGRARWMGMRPRVRGVVMNPVDHPLGGGEGKSSGGRPGCSPWGLPDGVKTRQNKTTNQVHSYEKNEEQIAGIRNLVIRMQRRIRCRDQLKKALLSTRAS